MTAPGRPRIDRFMVTCAARTGSTLLVRTLRSHPDVCMHGEVLGDTMVGLDGPLARRFGDDEPARAAFEAARFADPAATLEALLEPGDARVAGFKLKHDELVRAPWAPLLDLLAADARLGIVFLRRGDLLERYVSHQVVLRQTGVTNVPVGERLPDVQPLTVDIDDLLADAARTRQREAHFRAVFAAHASLSMDYEDLAADPQRECSRVFAFLGLADAPVTVATEKIIRRPLRELVRNFDAARTALVAARFG